MQFLFMSRIITKKCVVLSCLQPVKEPFNSSPSKYTNSYARRNGLRTAGMPYRSHFVRDFSLLYNEKLHYKATKSERCWLHFYMQMGSTIASSSFLKQLHWLPSRFRAWFKGAFEHVGCNLQLCNSSFGRIHCRDEQMVAPQPLLGRKA